MELKLNHKQATFCHEYVIDGNATQAAIRAGYSPKTAGEIGSEHLKKSHIQKRIKELQAERSKRCEIDADFVMKQIKRSIEINGTLIETPEGMQMTNAAAYNRAVEMAGKTMALFTDRQKVDMNAHPLEDAIKSLGL